MTAVVPDTLRPGDDWVFPLTFQNEDGTPVDVSGWTFPAPTWRVSQHAESPVVATATVDTSNGAQGIILYGTPAEVTAQWLDQYSTLYIDLPRTAPTHKTWCVVACTIEGDATRA